MLAPLFKGQVAILQLQKILDEVTDDFRNMLIIIKDSNTPVTQLEVFVSDASAVPYFQKVLNGFSMYRKYTQFSDIQKSTGINYIQELKVEYPSGVAKIADVSSNKVGGTNSALQSGINQPVSGQMILEIPVQTNAIPQSVINEANKWGIKIRDVQGKIY